MGFPGFFVFCFGLVFKQGKEDFIVAGGAGGGYHNYSRDHCDGILQWGEVLGSAPKEAGGKWECIAKGQGGGR